MPFATIMFQSVGTKGKLVAEVRLARLKADGGRRAPLRAFSEGACSWATDMLADCSSPQSQNARGSRQEDSQQEGQQVPKPPESAKRWPASFYVLRDMQLVETYCRCS